MQPSFPALAQRFQVHFGQQPTAYAFAPGRVNLIGEHTDYTGGWVLPTTVRRGIEVVIGPRADGMSTIYSLDYAEEATRPIDQRPQADWPLWQRYVFGVTYELAKGGLLKTGGDVMVQGSLPQGAGLSSSAALCVAVALVWQQATGFAMTGREMARLCQRVEQVHAGVACGIMDQMAVRLGQANHACLLHCHDLSMQHIPLDWASSSLLILDTKVTRTLAGSAYNDRQATSVAALAQLQQTGWSLESLHALVPEDLPRLAETLPPSTLRRVRHIVTENDRVRRAVVALRAGAMGHLGALMLASHASLRDDFEVSCPELDHLVEVAQTIPGVYGARMTGAGFGGCALALVRPAARTAATDLILEQFGARFGYTPGVLPLDGNRAAHALAVA